MNRFRYSIASMLGLVLFVAVAFAALREADEDWDSAVFSLTLGLLLTSVLLAVHRTCRKRAYWLGFSLFGWAYLVASLVPAVASSLPTSEALAVLREMIRAKPEIPWLDDLAMTNVLTFDVPTPVTTRNPPNRWGVAVFQQQAPPTVNYIKRVVGFGGTTGNFARIGHSLFALVFALTGALLSRRLYPGHGVTKRPEVMATKADH